MADATARPMKVPVTFVPYLEKYRVYELFQELLSRVIIKRPDDHLHFIRNELLDIIQPRVDRSLLEKEVKEDSKGSTSKSSHSKNLSNDGMNIEEVTQRKTSDLIPEDGSEEEGEKEVIQGSISYHMNETLASMNEKEFKKFSEEVISNWRIIRRSGKFFNIRELPPYQHAQEEKRYPEDSDTESDDENMGSNSITLIFHTRESANEITKESSQLQNEGLTDDGDLKLTQSVRSLDIKIKTEETLSNDSDKIYADGDEIVSVSYTETDDETGVEKIGSNEQIIHVKLLEGITSDDSNEMKEYIMKLIKEMVEEIILELPKHSLPQINLKFFQQLTMPKKMIHFPRGPIMIPRVVLLGPPGSRRCLHAKLLAKALKLIHVDMGLLLLGRDSTTGKIKITNLIRECSLKGNHLMTDISISILRERLLREDCLKKGWVLTGYPANGADARALDKIETPPNRIIYLDKPLEQCRELLSTRVFDVDTGEVGYIQPDPPERQGIKSRSDEILSELDNIVDIFGIQADKDNVVSGYLMELGAGNRKEGHGLFENIMECMYHRKRVLRSPEDDPKFIDLRFSNHEEFKSELLKYYGGWCTKLNIDSQPPRRVTEAILSVVTGPFPSFEEAGIDDRNADFRRDSTDIFGGQIEAKLKLEMLNFFSARNTQ